MATPISGSGTLGRHGRITVQLAPITGNMVLLGLAPHQLGEEDAGVHNQLGEVVVHEMGPTLDV
jgi:hypothetical protein